MQRDGPLTPGTARCGDAGAKRGNRRGLQERPPPALVRPRLAPLSKTGRGLFLMPAGDVIVPLQTACD
jgi:hypothetical protein